MVQRMEPDSRYTLILTTYVDAQTKSDLVALAARNDRSIAAELRLALRAHLEAARGTTGSELKRPYTAAAEGEPTT